MNMNNNYFAVTKSATVKTVVTVATPTALTVNQDILDVETFSYADCCANILRMNPR